MNTIPLFAFLFLIAFGHGMPQQGDETDNSGPSLAEQEEYGFVSLNGEVWNTTKCNREKFETASEEYKKCLIVQDQKIATALVLNPEDTEGFKKVTCESWAESITCIETLSEACYSSMFAARRINSLRTIFVKKVSEQEEVLGSDFLSTCPDLKEDRDALLEHLAGTPEKCSYAEYQHTLTLFKLCLDSIKESRTALNGRANVIDDLDIRKGVYIFSECRGYTTFRDTCAPLHTVCLSDEKANEVNELYFDREKTLIATGVFPLDFSFVKNCKGEEKEEKEEEEEEGLEKAPKADN